MHCALSGCEEPLAAILDPPGALPHPHCPSVLPPLCCSPGATGSDWGYCSRGPSDVAPRGAVAQVTLTFLPSRPSQAECYSGCRQQTWGARREGPVPLASRSDRASDPKRHPQCPRLWALLTSPPGAVSVLWLWGLPSKACPTSLGWEGQPLTTDHFHSPLQLWPFVCRPSPPLKGLCNVLLPLFLFTKVFFFVFFF
jgi:hypothetical protein